MAKETFRGKKFGADKIALLKKITMIVDEYDDKGLKMTLRQLYYQLVARGFIPNNLKEYAKLSCLLTDARYTGLVDWDNIEDNGRIPEMHAEWYNVHGLIESAISSYRLNRWNGQEYYVELFTEKDALRSVLQPIANKWHIHFCVNRGYSSATAMYDLSKRIINAMNDDKTPVILYLGDHDPSGLDMARDIKERLSEFLEEGEDYYDSSKIIIDRIGLTQEQIKKYNPPTNPAKMSDPRAKWYVENFGKVSWEVDALRPEVMNELVNDAIEEYCDTKLMKEIIDKENVQKKRLVQYANTLDHNEE